MNTFVVKAFLETFVTDNYLRLCLQFALCFICITPSVQPSTETFWINEHTKGLLCATYYVTNVTAKSR